MNDASPDGLRIERSTLHDMVISRIRDMIIEGKLPPGKRIHEGLLGQQLGISRTPLREALKVLASEGLVELIPGRGATVRKLTQKDVRDMLNVLSHLESFAAPLICQNATEENIREIRALHEEMLVYFEARNRLPYFKLNQQIHSALMTSTGNESLCSVHGILLTRMKRIRYMGGRTEETWQGAIRDHEEIVMALEARDGARLSAALVHHLAEAWERIKDAV